MNTHTIDTAMAKRLIETAAIRGAAIIGRPGGWSVVIKLGKQDKTLGVQRSDKPRIWRSLDRCVEFLKKELHIARFELLDATNHSDIALIGKSRADSSERLRKAHEAAAYDVWFRKQVQVSIDDLRPEIPHDVVEAKFAAKREALYKRIR